MLRPTYDTHQHRVVTADGVTHAAPALSHPAHTIITTCVTVIPATDEELVHAPTAPVSCAGCLLILHLHITCPACGTPGAQEYSEPIPGTDDSVDCARCTACDHSWVLDPGADLACVACGGSGDPGGIYRHPRIHCACLAANL